MRTLLLMVLLTSTLAAAQPAQTMRVQPPDVVVFDEDTQAVVTANADGSFTMPETQSIPHHWRIQRPHFDVAQVTLVWAGRWQIQTPARVVDVGPDTVVWLNKTLRLNVRPSDFRVFMEAPADPRGRVFLYEVDGQDVAVRPMPQRGDEIVVPHAWAPPNLIIGKHNFAMHRLTIDAGALDNDAPTFPPEPIYLVPRFGWLSYPMFDVALGLGLLAGLVLGGVRLVRVLRAVPTPPPEEQVEAPPEEEPSPETGTELVTSDGGNRYVLLSRLGGGGMGSVFEATDRSTGGTVAIKMLEERRQENVSHQARFAREIQVCARLDHPAIVKCLDWGMWKSEEGAMIPFMVMERVAGRSLRQVVDARPGPQPLAEVVRWLRDTLSGLQVAHDAGVVHRDIKPDNLMLTDDGDHIKIVDFGVARDASRRQITGTGAMLGTPKYMSPEHLDAGKAGPPSDIYSLGAVAYELLSGHAAFTGDAWAIVSKITIGHVIPLNSVNPRLPSDLVAIVQRMMATNPEDRYQTALEVVEALDQAGF